MEPALVSCYYLEDFQKGPASELIPIVSQSLMLIEDLWENGNHAFYTCKHEWKDQYFFYDRVHSLSKFLSFPSQRFFELPVPE